jgi:hypothetical protein
MHFSRSYFFCMKAPAIAIARALLGLDEQNVDRARQSQPRLSPPRALSPVS